VSRWYGERWAEAQRAAPNAAHLEIARWQRLFPSLLVVTQNVDRLHQRAGSAEVVELHGTLGRWRCASCGGEIAAEQLPAGWPAACACGGWLRPGVVWFGELLPAAAYERAAAASRAADLFAVVGTSATVWPAAGLIELAAGSGALVIEVNREPTPLSELATITWRGAAGEVLSRLGAEIGRWRSPR
jgi:NAD-dependent deacetylase